MNDYDNYYKQALSFYNLKRYKEAAECARKYFQLTYRHYPQHHPNIDYRLKIDMIKYLLNYYRTLLHKWHKYFKINNEGWLFLLLNKKFIAKTIACFLIENGKKLNNNEMYYFGKNLLASTLVRSRKIMDIKKARELFEDIVKNSPISYSVLDYEMCKEKLINPSKFGIIDRKEKKDYINEIISLLSISSNKIKLILDEISQMSILDSNLKNKVFQYLMKIMEQYPETSYQIYEFLSYIKKTKFKTFKIYISNPCIGFGYYSFEGEVEIYLNNRLILNEYIGFIYPDSFLRGITQNILIDFKKKLGDHVLLEMYADHYPCARGNPGFYWNVTHNEENVIIDNICWYTNKEHSQEFTEIKGKFQVKLMDYKSEVLLLKKLSEKTYKYYEKMNYVWK